MKACISVEIGTDKNECEDTALFNDVLINNRSVCVETDALRCVCVADGVGGNAGGRIASRYIAHRISQIDFTFMNDIEISAVVADINADLINYAASISGKTEMATTLTCMVSADDGYYLIHTGNTRLYVMQGAYLKQLTTDQTTYYWLIEHGCYEAAEKCNKSEINSCLGGGDSRFAERLIVRKIFDNDLPDTLIFTSDGIHEFVDIDFIEDSLAEAGSDIEAVRLITEKACLNGSIDDKTIIILRR